MPDMKKIKLPNMILVLSMMVLVVVATFSATYAYFKAKLFNLESSQTLAIAGGKMEITFNGEGTEGNTGNIVANGIIPGWKTTKVFTLTGENETDAHGTGVDNKMYYKVGIVVEEHTFSEGSFHYTLTKDATSSTNGKMLEEKYGAINTSGTTWLGIGYFDVTTQKENHKYNLEISYPDNGKDQSGNNGKSFKAYVTIDTINPSDLVTVNIDLDGGAFPNSYGTTLKVEKNTTITLPEPKKDRHLLVSWEVTGGTINGNVLTVRTSDVSVKAIYREANYFETDSWAEIVANLKTETGRSRYAAGNTREIVLKDKQNTETGSNGKYTIRVANNSNYGCTLESETACGFVVEFVDIIESRRMNETNTNAGGWPGSELYGYMSEIFDMLPSELKGAIIDTPVVSGHGSRDKNPNRTDGNWTSTDKLYLLSTREVWGNCSGGTNNSAGCWDSGSSDTITRQLDYYEKLGVVTSDSNLYKNAVKKLGNSITYWWLRSARSNYSNFFSYVDSGGDQDTAGASNSRGIAPAFRLAG